MLPNKPIFCFNCNRKIGEWDRKSQVNKTIRCKCGEYNLYKVDTGKTEKTNMPERKSSAGMTFR